MKELRNNKFEIICLIKNKKRERELLILPVFIIMKFNLFIDNFLFFFML